MRLTIVLPVYNEHATLRETIRRVRAVELPQEIETEILAVDDASTDGSTQILADEAHAGDLRVFRHSVHRGRGACVETGIAHATGELLLVQGAGLGCDPADLPRLIQPIVDGTYPVVYGSRISAPPQERPWVHEPGKRLLALTGRLLYGATLSDVRTCSKAFRTEAVRGLALRSRSSELELEITAKVLKRGHRILEVPISYPSCGPMPGKRAARGDALRASWTLLKYRFVD